MFTGIIEEKGKITALKKDLENAKIAISAKKILTDLKLGDSISVNGICLTASKITGEGFIADVMPETFNRSSLGELKKDDLVNLERALSASGRFGGHFVSGHIDGTGKIISRKNVGNAILVIIECPEKITDYIVEKGSIAIDGISLTVVSVAKNNFSISLIPHTAENTTLLDKKIGETVNLENDLLAKYVKKFVGKSDKLDMEFLLKSGF